MSVYTPFVQIYAAMEDDALEHLNFTHTVFLNQDGTIYEEEWRLDVDGFCVVDDITKNAFLFLVKNLNAQGKAKQLEKLAKAMGKTIAENWDHKNTIEKQL